MQTFAIYPSTLTWGKLPYLEIDLFFLIILVLLLQSAYSTNGQKDYILEL